MQPLPQVNAASNTLGYADLKALLDSVLLSFLRSSTVTKDLSLSLHFAPPCFLSSIFRTNRALTLVENKSIL